jgi:hypothetical protein
MGLTLKKTVAVLPPKSVADLPPGLKDWLKYHMQMEEQKATEKYLSGKILDVARTKIRSWNPLSPAVTEEQASKAATIISRYALLTGVLESCASADDFRDASGGFKRLLAGYATSLKTVLGEKTLYRLAPSYKEFMAAVGTPRWVDANLVHLHEYLALFGKAIEELQTPER